MQGGYQAPPCSRTCHEVACSDINLKYGKYCGVGHGGCPGDFVQQFCDCIPCLLVGARASMLLMTFQLLSQLVSTAGEAPCDGLDACCKSHDDCVERSGMLANKCHSAFVTCMQKEKRHNKTGFSGKVHTKPFLCAVLFICILPLIVQPSSLT